MCITSVLSPSPGRQERNDIILDRRIDSEFCWRNSVNSIITRRCSKNDQVADMRHFHFKFKPWAAVEKEKTLKRIITYPCSIMTTQHISLILASSPSPGTKVRNCVKDNRLLDLEFFMMTSEEHRIVLRSWTDSGSKRCQ
ncbi:hypothetical protein CHS0354_041078 [Potamilus streckersoni]|uniref:Uncharacterized protein n=1 Tax=Potamilus streckersoni TaxID=2493646 RepID=A0AAE0SDT7_9BIVA|nr:hypothetical protein CHS0354_041078 [Potamilus streckersoni]